MSKNRHIFINKFSWYSGKTTTAKKSLFMNLHGNFFAEMVLLMRKYAVGESGNEWATNNV